MSNVNAEIDSLKRDIERSRSELSQMYSELGEAASMWHRAINYEPSQEAYEKLQSVIQEKNDIEGKLNVLKNAINEVSASDRHIEETRLSLKELDRRYAVLISSLGAVAIETDSAGRLPHRLVRYLEPMRDYEKNLEKCYAKAEKFEKSGPKFMASVYKKKMEKMKGSLDSIFMETGRRIYNSGNFRDVPGQRAKTILDEMEAIRFAKKNYKNDILDHKSLIDEAHGSLDSLGATGDENRKLRELQNTWDLISDRLTDRFTEYGQILAEGIPYWMYEGTPEELKRCCTVIIRQTKRIAQQNLNLEHLMMEKNIEIHNMQLSQLSEQMNHLNAQIQAIENQKSELQQRLNVELKSVSELRMKQNEISKKASEL